MKTLLHRALETGASRTGFTENRIRRAWPASLGIIPSSVTVDKRGIFALLERGESPLLVIASPDPRTLDGFVGETVSDTAGSTVWRLLSGPLVHENAVCLRDALPWTAPSALEGRQSFGTGDRIGGKASATPGHIDALSGSGFTPVLAQQSVRENHKTGRTFKGVMDDVTWAVFREGFRLPWGSDADHLKTFEDIENAVMAGFTMFTLDPSEKIDNGADADPDDVLAAKFAALFPSHRGADAFITRHEGKEGASRSDVVRAGVKYIAAIRHAAAAYDRLSILKSGAGFNFEMSIDETSTPTSPLDHRIIATELARSGVTLFSLAPRFAGAFEKGIDYKGTPDGFRRSLEPHVRLAREMGGYRLSLHSGSDKFSVYPMFGELTDGFFHVKTAGTSYLEAVRTAAMDDIALFRRILALSLETFYENAASYQISANPKNVPPPKTLSSENADRLLTENPDLRQVLHIAFGVVLQTFGDEFRDMLARNSSRYRSFLARHIGRHVSLLKGG